MAVRGVPIDGFPELCQVLFLPLDQHGLVENLLAQLAVSSLNFCNALIEVPGVRSMREAAIEQRKQARNIGEKYAELKQRTPHRGTRILLVFER